MGSLKGERKEVKIMILQGVSSREKGIKEPWVWFWNLLAGPRAKWEGGGSGIRGGLRQGANGGGKEKLVQCLPDRKVLITTK